jgi:hypothetical protein
MPNTTESSVSTAHWLNLSETQPRLGVIHVTGPDSGKFLQGQLSADIAKLQPGAHTLAGLHNREGRVVAMLRVLALSATDFVAVLPRELVSDTVERLRKFVLRAKAVVQDESDALCVWGAASAVPVLASAAATSPWGAGRQIAIAPRTNNLTSVSPEAAQQTRAAWQAADIADGLPQVYRATSEAFVSQMLNLDVLGAIAFDKGCYTGQEVIARAHYRGRVKRRLQRFRATGEQALRVGAEGHFVGGAAFRVVEVASSTPTEIEFLAVTTLSDAGESPASTTPSATAVLAESLPLPYALPS